MIEISFWPMETPEKNIRPYKFTINQIKKWTIIYLKFTVLNI